MTLEIGKDHPNCSMRIVDAEELAKRYDLQGTLLLGIRKDGVVELVTYGDHPAQKTSMGDLSETISANLLTKVPFQTMFGWGNDGVPKALSDVEVDILKNEKGWTQEQIDRATHPDAE